jgi:hypothetical protein
MEIYMTILNKFNLVVSKRVANTNPIFAKRNKLLAKLDEQIELATAKNEGRAYLPTKLKTYINNETGEKKVIETTKRVKEWYWLNADGKIILTVKYGSKTLELNKGKNAIELDNESEVINTYKLLKEAVTNGELDDAIKLISKVTKDNFVK